MPPDGDAAAAQAWAVVGLFAILLGGSLGVALPLLGRRAAPNSTGGATFALGRAFAAGVVFATGMVHVFPAAMHALESPQLQWPRFPWASVIATAAALCTNAIEFAAGQSFSGPEPVDATAEPGDANNSVEAPLLQGGNGERAVSPFSAERPGGADRHQAVAALGRPSRKRTRRSHMHSGLLHAERAQSSQQLGQPSSLRRSSASAAWTQARRVAIAQVLELGIALHSVLIGVALGVSTSVGAVRPLAAALVFHQSFEGFALGSALADTGHEGWQFASRGTAFALTTPIGVAIGLAIRESYSPRSCTALVVSGAFNAISAGILMHMALVDLVAVDFFSPRMRAAPPAFQVAAYGALFAGAAAMALIAIWA